MALLTAADIKEQMATTLADDVIEAILDREQAALERKLGAAYDGTAISETFVQELPGGEQSLFLPRRIESVTSVTEKATPSDSATTLTSSEYYIIHNQGRILRLGAYWGMVATVVYIPQDDTQEWKRALAELVRLAVSRTALKSENIAGEYSYTAPDNWDQERTKILQSIGFFNI